MARKIVLADASPLIALARVDGLPWLRRLQLALGAQTLVLLDDLQARREAERPGITITGTAGLIVEARRAGLIPAAGPVLARLAEEGFHLGDDLIQAILAELGEA